MVHADQQTGVSEVQTLVSTTRLSRFKGDRGAVLVEAAIALPLLLLVILGSLEFGIAWDTKSATTSGLRSSLLRVATEGEEIGETDIRVMQSILGEVDADNAEKLDWVVIFDADPANGDIETIVNTCTTALAAGGNHDFCVAYDTDTLVEVATTTDTELYRQENFDPGNADLLADGTYPCADTLATGGDALDAGGFCAASRTATGDIEIGIAFQYQHDWVTGILPFDAPALSLIHISEPTRPY